MLNFFRNYKFIVLSASLIIMLWLAGRVTTFNRTLENSVATRKIVSLELAWSQQRAAEVVASWNGSVKNDAIRSILEDNFFILGYSLFLAFCVLARNKGKTISKPSIVFLAIITAAALCDYIENFFMMSFIRSFDVYHLFFSLPASIKFGLLIIVAGYLIYTLRHKTRYVTWFLKAAYLYAAGLVAVVICYFVLIGLTQGQDVIIQLAEYNLPLMFTLISIILFAVFAWYSSRMVGYYKAMQPENIIPRFMHRHFARLIAYNGAVCVQAAILALPSLTRMNSVEILAFVLFQNFMYVAFNARFRRKKNWKVYQVIIIVVSIVFLIWTFLHFQRGSNVHQRWLPIVAITLYFIEGLLVVLFVARRNQLQRSGSEPTHQKLFGRIPIPVFIRSSELTYFRVFNIFALVGLTLYVGAFFSIHLANYMGSVSYMMLAFGMLIGLSNIFTILSISTRTNFFFLLLVLALIVGSFYKIRIG
jgi:hypothetical protein